MDEKRVSGDTYDEQRDLCDDRSDRPHSKSRVCGVEGHDLSSLRLLGSTGEPWDPESWMWFYEHVGGDTPIINISGGTELCGCFLMPLPKQSVKPCTLGGPGLGMDIDIVNQEGEFVADRHERGFLVARSSCPSMTKSLWSGDERYLDEYWPTFTEPPMWNHGDWAQKDEDGFWFLHGRADDVLNVAGRKVGPAEVEGALIDHDAVNQAAAVGVPDDTTGTAVVTYVILEPNYEASDTLRGELRKQIDVELGKPFKPREVLFVDEFPRRSRGRSSAELSRQCTVVRRSETYQVSIIQAHSKRCKTLSNARSRTIPRGCEVTATLTFCSDQLLV